MRKLIVFVLLGTLSPLATAHAEPGAHHWWTLDPWVWLPMALFGALYLRGACLLRTKRTLHHVALACFLLGMAALFLALIWPLDALGEISFAAHMAQHMLLMAVAAPLFSVAGTSVAMMVALPARGRRIGTWIGRRWKWLLRPRIAFALHATMIWFWHAPLPFEWALQSQPVHALEHVSFLGSAMLFWSGLQRATRAGGTGGEGYGSAALWILMTLMHTGLLGALITFAPRPLYASYIEVGTVMLSPMEDQQLAGLLMWIPGGLCYLAAGLAYAAAWLKRSERRDRHATTGPRATTLNSRTTHPGTGQWRP